MKKKLQRYMAIIAITVITMAMAQCKKNNPTNIGTVKPGITDISPLQGLAGTLVTISGAGFDTTRATTTVKINGEVATIQSLTSTQINFVIPKKATTGKITLANKDTTITFPANFTVNSLTVAKLPATNTFDGAEISNIAVDAAGNIFCNTSTDTVFKISPLGIKSMLAKVGNGNIKLGGIAVDATGNIYTVGTNDFKIYKMTSAGAPSIFAGSGVSGHADGQGTGAQFTAPAGMAIDASGNLYITDVYRIRKITPTGQVSTFAGNATAGKANGQGISATFGTYGALKNIAIDFAGNIYVSDGDNGQLTYSIINSNFYIRKITPAGAVSTIGPLPTQMASWTGGKGPLSLPFTSLLAVDAAGNLYLPGSAYNNGSNASGGCCTFGPVFMVNRALNSSEFFELSQIFSLVTMKYNGITSDPSGNIYINAVVSYGHRFYEPPSIGTRGSLILKLKIN